MQKCILQIDKRLIADMCLYGDQHEREGSGSGERGVERGRGDCRHIKRMSHALFASFTQIESDNV